MLVITVSFEMHQIALVQLLFITYMFGAIIAGYLVSRKAFQDYLKIGLKTGLGSFFFHIYVFMGVLELIAGKRILLLGDHLLILAIFILGSFVGSYLCKQFSSDKIRTT